MFFKIGDVIELLPVVAGAGGELAIAHCPQFPPKREARDRQAELVPYLSTVLDDYSRYIIAWKLCSTMRAEDVTNTLDLALAASGCDQVNVHHKPRLLSDNGPCYIAGELAEYIEAQRMSHVRGAPFHPHIQPQPMILK